jgi:hypothetical protein
MFDSAQRLFPKVENRVPYRRDNSKTLSDLPEKECGLVRSSIIADVESVTGILSELFWQYDVHAEVESAG